MGKTRGNHEDNFYFKGQFLPESNQGSGGGLAFCCFPEERPEWVAVFDGMGGHVGGECAAHAGAAALKAALEREEETSMEELLRQASQAVYSTARRRKLGGMGTTVVAAKVWRDRLTLANLGDSPGFLLHGGRLEKLSRDHTDAELLRQLNITGRKPHLTQYLGVDPEEMDVEPWVTQRRLENGDRLLLCSDGLTDLVTQPELERELNRGSTPMKTAEALLALALDRGGTDNVTIIVGFAERGVFLGK